MQRTVIFTADLLPLKLISSVRVANRTLRPDKPFPLWIDAKAKWDTGADCCFVSRELCRKLKLESKVDIPVSSFSATDEGVASMVLLDLQFDGSFIPTICVVVDAIAGADCDMLIGMNIICQGDFYVSTDRTSGQIKVSFTPYPGTLKKLY